MGETTVGFLIVADLPVETYNTKLSETTIEPRKIEELPLNGRTFKTMGLIALPAQNEKAKKKKKKN